MTQVNDAQAGWRRPHDALDWPVVSLHERGTQWFVAVDEHLQRASQEGRSHLPFQAPAGCDVQGRIAGPRLLERPMLTLGDRAGELLRYLHEGPLGAVSFHHCQHGNPLFLYSAICASELAQLGRSSHCHDGRLHLWIIERYAPGRDRAVAQQVLRGGGNAGPADPCGNLESEAVAGGDDDRQVAILHHRRERGGGIVGVEQHEG